MSQAQDKGKRTVVGWCLAPRRGASWGRRRVVAGIGVALVGVLFAHLGVAVPEAGLVVADRLLGDLVARDIGSNLHAHVLVPLAVVMLRVALLLLKVPIARDDRARRDAGANRLVPQAAGALMPAWLLLVKTFTRDRLLCAVARERAGRPRAVGVLDARALLVVSEAADVDACNGARQPQGSASE